jgi:hypothetical protein
MSSHFVMPSTPQQGTAWANILPQPISEGSVPFGPPTKPSSFWRKVVHRLTRHPHIKPATITVMPSSKTTSAEMPAILLDERMSAEDREAREKGLALAARIEYLYQTDTEFRRWYHEGIDEIEAGHFVTFSEDGWKDE